MATGKITIASLRGLEGWLWDTAVLGFGARRQTKGIFYYLRYRRDGAQRMHSIGRHGSPWTPDTARNEALRLLGSVVGGDDPFAKSIAAESFSDEVARYLERKRAGLQPSSFKEIKRFLTGHCAVLASLSLTDIDRRTIALVLGEIERDRGPVARNRARSALSTFFGWCVTEGLLNTNPVAGTAKVDEGRGRERILSDDELRQLWAALGSEPLADIIRLLLLTGQRRNEIGALQWSEVDLARKLVVLSAERTKNKRKHEVPLSRQALAVIERQPRRNSSPYLFSDVKGFKNWDAAKARLDARLHIAPYVIHDIRRSVATGMAELGVQPHHIEAILNHVSGHKAGIAGIYNRAKYAEEMRNALQRWADHLDQITTA
jgi:integrase